MLQIAAIMRHHVNDFPSTLTLLHLRFSHVKPQLKMLLSVITASHRFIIVTREVITFITFTIILLIQPIKANVLSNLLRIRTLYHNFSWYICTTLPMRLVEPRSIKRQQNNGVCKVATANTSHHANSDLTTWERCEKWMEDTEVPWLQFSTKQSTLAIFAFTLDYKVIAFVETTRLHCLGSQRRICEGRVELHIGKQLYVCQFKFYIFY